MFKVGERAELLVGRGSYNAGQTFEVVGLKYDGWDELEFVKIKNDKGTVLTWFAERLRPVTKERKMNKVEKGGVYTFKVRDSEMICAEEISISRENPIAVVQAKGINALYVYRTVVAKAEVLGINLDYGTKWSDESLIILCKSPKKLSKRLNKLKKILKAPWPSSETLTVRVKLIGSTNA